MSRRRDPAFKELLTAAMLYVLPAHKEARTSAAQAAVRLAKAADVPRGALIGWPAAAAELIVRAQLSLDGKPGGLDKASIEAAIDAHWPRHAPEAHYAWQDRRDIGDGMAA